MEATNWFYTAGGIGIFWFALHILNQVMSRSFSLRIKPWLNRVFSSTSRGISLGVLVTMLVQASSTTIIAAMGLLDATLLSIEQAFAVMLGATIGTTVKAWFYTLFTTSTYIPWLICIGSITLLFLVNPLLRDLLEAILSIGLVFLGLKFLALGLAPLQQNPVLLNMLQWPVGQSMLSQIAGVLMGIAVTMLFQSSSAAVFLVLTLAQQGMLTYQAGAALILGANIGTTSTALLASLAFARKGRRLAFAHLWIKVCGVLLALLLFGPLLSAMDFVIPGQPIGSQLPYHLAAVHTGFNVCNVLLWGFTAPLFLRFLRWLMPVRIDKVQPFSAPVVWRMLVSSPKRAWQESLQLFDELKKTTKHISDESLVVLMDHNQPLRSRAARWNLTRQFEHCKEGLFFLLLQSKYQERSVVEQQIIQQQLHRVEHYDKLFYQWLDFYDLLEEGIAINRHQLPQVLQPQLRNIQKQLNQMWLVLLSEKGNPGKQKALRALLRELDQSFFDEIERHPNQSPDIYSWIHQVIYGLRFILQQMHAIAQMQPQAETKKPKTKKSKAKKPKTKKSTQNADAPGVHDDKNEGESTHSTFPARSHHALVSVQKVAALTTQEQDSSSPQTNKEATMSEATSLTEPPTMTTEQTQPSEEEPDPSSR